MIVTRIIHASVHAARIKAGIKQLRELAQAAPQRPYRRNVNRHQEQSHRAGNIAREIVRHAGEFQNQTRDHQHRQRGHRPTHQVSKRFPSESL